MSNRLVVDITDAAKQAIANEERRGQAYADDYVERFTGQRFGEYVINVCPDRLILQGATPSNKKVTEALATDMLKGLPKEGGTSFTETVRDRLKKVADEAYAAEAEATKQAEVEAEKLKARLKELEATNKALAAENKQLAKAAK